VHPGRGSAPGSRIESDSTGPFERVSESPVVLGIGYEREIDVEENAIDALRREAVDQFCVDFPRPRPIADLVQGPVVDEKEDGIAARLVFMEAVAPDPKPIFGDFAKTDQPEDEAG
jgi:hypothetical protein